MDALSSIVNLNFISLAPLGCIVRSNYHASLLTYTISPIVVILGLTAVYKAKEGDQELRNRVFSWGLFLVFLILPSISVFIFTTFACKQFDGGYGTYLKADYSIDCNSSGHFSFVVYAAFASLIYPVGIPCIYMRLLWKVRNKLDPPPPGAHAGQAGNNNWFTTTGQAMFTTKTGDSKQGVEQAIEERSKHEGDPEVKRLSFLYNAYEPRCWWFEVFETVRKLALTGFLVFLKPGTAAQIVMSMVLCIGAMRVYANYKPFVKDIHDITAEVTQWQIYFTMFAALAIRVNLDGATLEDKMYFDGCLVVLQLVAPTVVMIYFIKERKRLINHIVVAVRGESDDRTSQGRRVEMQRIPSANNDALILEALGERSPRAKELLRRKISETNRVRSESDGRRLEVEAALERERIAADAARTELSGALEVAKSALRQSLATEAMLRTSLATSEGKRQDTETTLARERRSWAEQQVQRTQTTDLSRHRSEEAHL